MEQTTALLLGAQATRRHGTQTYWTRETVPETQEGTRYTVTAVSEKYRSLPFLPLQTATVLAMEGAHFLVGIWPGEGRGEEVASKRLKPEPATRGAADVRRDTDKGMLYMMAQWPAGPHRG